MIIKVYLLTLLLAMLNFVSLSQERNDLEVWQLKGKVHQINYYEQYNFSTADPANSSERILSNINVFNRSGNLRVQFEFSGNGGDCLYKKTVYSYNRKNRKTLKSIFQSAKNEAFCKSKASLFADSQPENIDAKLSLLEKTIFTYDRRGRKIKEATFDNKHTIVQENKYHYNRRGENTRFTLTQKQNRISGSSGSFIKKIDFQMSYRNNGNIKTTYRYEDGKPIYKIINYSDKKGRFVQEKQYKLESIRSSRISKSTMTSHSKTHYDQNKEILDWTIFDNNGQLQTRLYILSENDNEILRLEYIRHKESVIQNPTQLQSLTHYRIESENNVKLNRQLKYLLKYDRSIENPEWIPARFETRDYKFDAQGNIIQSVTSQRDAPGKADKSKTIYERELTYFR